MPRLVCALLIAAALATSAAPALALKMEAERARPWRLVLSGPINPGDADRLVRFLLEPLADQPLLASEIVLASPGGNLVEAMRLAALVRGLHLDTRVRADSACSSACFFVFIAGDNRLAGEKSAGGLRPGRIGLHRPHLGGDALKKGDAAGGAQRQQLEMGKVVDYLRRESVPLRLIDEMMSHASNDIYWLSDADLWQLGEFHPGLEEVLIARCAYDKRLTSSAYEQLLLGLEGREREAGQAQLAKLMGCIAGTRAGFDRTRDEFLQKLKAGYRP